MADNNLYPVVDIPEYEEENEEYDIIHNPEKFILYVDGEKVE